MSSRQGKSNHSEKIKHIKCPACKIPLGYQRRSSREAVLIRDKIELAEQLEDVIPNNVVSNNELQSLDLKVALECFKQLRSEFELISNQFKL